MQTIFNLCKRILLIDFTFWGVNFNLFQVLMYDIIASLIVYVLFRQFR